MFNPNDNYSIGHDLENRARTSDVTQGEKVPFSSLLLKEEIHKGLIRCGYTYLSPIQKTALPLALTGSSIIAHAKSGTGKTLVYLLPALSNILEKKQSGIQCLILSPTREIAKQIYDVFNNVGYYIKGGTALDLDVLKCKDCQIAIGAPGRIRHLIELGEMNIESIQLFILDEVDALLKNKEFAIPELALLLPPDKQTIVCTATFSDKIDDLLRPIAQNIKYVTINERTNDENCTPGISNILLGIKQYVAPITSDGSSFDTIRKRMKLVEILSNFKYDQCFVFVNYVTIAKSLANLLLSNQIPAVFMTSEQSQSVRIATINRLKSRQCNILITTDLAARGIDVHDVNLVINMGVPSPPDVYIHRMGRAGRYGSEGGVVTILGAGNEMENFLHLIKAVSTDSVDLYVLPYEVNKKTLSKELQTIRCNPETNPSINISEYVFKKQNEMQTKTTSKRKSKKCRNKSLKREDVSPRKAIKMSTSSEIHENSNIVNQQTALPLRVDINLEMLKLVEQYIKTVIEEVNKKSIVIDEETAKNFFKTDSKMNVIEFSDYFVPNYDEVDGKHKENDNVTEDYRSSESLQNFLDFIIRKHHFLDEQRIPCSVEQFLAIIKYGKNLIKEYVSPNLHDCVNEIFEKIETMDPRIFRSSMIPSLSMEPELQKVFTKPTRSLELTSVDSYEEDRMLLNSESRPDRTSSNSSNESEEEYPTIKRIVKKNHTGSEETSAVNASMKTLSNSQNEPTAWKYNPFLSRNPTNLNLIRAQVERLVQPVPKQSGIFPLSLTIPVDRTQIDIQDAGPSRVSSVVEKNNGRQVPSDEILPPLTAYVNSRTGQNIWRHHFNFIGSHLRSLPYRFENE